MELLALTGPKVMLEYQVQLLALVRPLILNIKTSSSLLHFIDGDFIQGQTDLKTATLLEAICGQSSGDERVQSLKDHEKYMRFLRDAPRTYYEVKDELRPLWLRDVWSNKRR